MDTLDGNFYFVHYVFMDKIEINFLTQEFKLLVCFRYIDDVFFIWKHGKEKLEELLKDFNNYHLGVVIEFTMTSVKKALLYWTLSWTCLEVNWPQTCISLLANIITCPIHLFIQTIPNFPLFLVTLRQVSRIGYNKIDFERQLYNMK